MTVARPISSAQEIGQQHNAGIAAYSITSSARARQRRVTRQGEALGPGTVRACSGHLPASMIQLMEATMPIDEYAKGGAHERAKDEAHE